MDTGELQRIAWVDAYSVGIDDLDAQNKRLIDIINALADRHASMVSTGVSGSLAEILSAIFDYFQSHFKTEEYYMRGGGYPRAQEHCRMHDACIEKIAVFNFKALSGVVFPADVHRFLIDWWVTHILIADMSFKNFNLERRGGTSRRTASSSS